MCVVSVVFGNCSSAIISPMVSFGLPRHACLLPIYCSLTVKESLVPDRIAFFVIENPLEMFTYFQTFDCNTRKLTSISFMCSVTFVGKILEQAVRRLQR